MKLFRLLEMLTGDLEWDGPPITYDELLTYDVQVFPAPNITSLGGTVDKVYLDRQDRTINIDVS